MACDTLDASTLFPRPETDPGLLDCYGAYLFVPWLYPQAKPDDIVSAMLRAYLGDRNLGGILHPPESLDFATFGLDEAVLRRGALADVTRAGVCLDRCVAWATRRPYDVVGFSVTFETQLPAALALARRLKALNPGLKIVFGGAACPENQGDALVLGFSFIDAVCHTEGERAIVPLIRAMRGEVALGDVPGVAWMDEAGRLHHTPASPLLTDLDELPIPDYGPFIAQLEDSEWFLEEPTLFFETSRGCWWGQKHLCTFCGLNAEGLVFRRKSPERAFEEIRALYRGYPTAGRLQAADNILDMGYFKSLLPRLAAMPKLPLRPLRMFFETKSNLTREQLGLLREAGVDAIQPGIESFSDGVLALMDKGTTGLRQVQLIKWAAEAGIRLNYNLILASPGERTEHYREMADLLPALAHLPPPASVVSMMLHRFSPYHTAPERHGIRNVRPRGHYRDLFPDGAVDLSRLAYAFDFDHDMQRDPELALAQRSLAQQLERWSRGFRPGSVFARDDGAFVIVHDSRDGPGRTDALSGVAADVLRYLDECRPLEAALRRFADLDPDLLLALLERWVHRRWVARDGRGRLLAVIPRETSRGP